MFWMVTARGLSWQLWSRLWGHVSIFKKLRLKSFTLVSIYFEGVSGRELCWQLLSRLWGHVSMFKKLRLNSITCPLVWIYFEWRVWEGIKLATIISTTHPAAPFCDPSDTETLLRCHFRNRSHNRGLHTAQQSTTHYNGATTEGLQASHQVPPLPISHCCQEQNWENLGQIVKQYIIARLHQKQQLHKWSFWEEFSRRKVFPKDDLCNFHFL